MGEPNRRFLESARSQIHQRLREGGASRRISIGVYTGRLGLMIPTCLLETSLPSWRRAPSGQHSFIHYFKLSDQMLLDTEPESEPVGQWVDKRRRMGGVRFSTQKQLD